MSEEYQFYVPYDKLQDYRKKNTPDACPILGMSGDKFTPVVDHDHNSGRVRGVISLEVNALMGKIENFFRTRCVNTTVSLPDTLRKIATYLEASQGPYHPIGLKQVTRRFSRVNKKQQIDSLLSMGAATSQIEGCKSAAKRTAMYRKLLVEGRKAN
jgi:hypothetical protein